MFTRRGIAVIFFGVFLWITGRVLGAPEFYILGTGALVSVSVAFVYVNVRRFDIAVARIAVPHKAHVDQHATIYLRLMNRARIPTPPLVVRDSVGQWGEARHLAEPIPPRTRLEVHYRLPTMRRGRMTLGPTELAAIDPLGLAVRARFVERTTSLLVLPRVRSLVPPPVPSQSSTAVARDHRVSGNDDDFSLRSYRDGDDARLIHWRSSARRGVLLVREPLAQTSAGCTILLDRTKVESSMFEEMVSMCASLLASADKEDMPFQLLTSDGFASPLSEGEKHLDSLMDYLAEVDMNDANKPNSDYLRKSASAVIITTGRSQLVHTLSSKLAVMRQEASRVVVSFGPTAVAPVPKTSIIPVLDASQFQKVWNNAVGYDIAKRFRR